MPMLEKTPTADLNHDQKTRQPPPLRQSGPCSDGCGSLGLRPDSPVCVWTGTLPALHLPTLAVCDHRGFRGAGRGFQPQKAGKEGFFYDFSGRTGLFGRRNDRFLPYRRRTALVEIGSGGLHRHI